MVDVRGRSEPSSRCRRCTRDPCIGEPWVEEEGAPLLDRCGRPRVIRAGELLDHAVDAIIRELDG